MCFATFCDLPTLSVTITVVFAWCSKPKMRDVHAAPVVASVHHDHAWWNAAMSLFVNEPMRFFDFLSSPNMSIAHASVGQPRPAFIRRIALNFFPEAMGEH